MGYDKTRRPVSKREMARKIKAYDAFMAAAIGKPPPKPVKKPTGGR